MRIFLTATDTDAGKTYAALAWLRAGEGRRVLKPVAAGADARGRNPDVALLADAQRLPASAINLYAYRTPAAPLFAARAEQAPLPDPDALVAWCAAQGNAAREVMIEGIGGVRVPLAPGFEVRDWIARLPEWEVWVVARARIGAINHTLLTLEALAAIGRTPVWVVVNQAEPGMDAAAAMLAESVSLAFPQVGVALLGYREGWPPKASKSPSAGSAERMRPL